MASPQEYRYQSFVSSINRGSKQKTRGERERHMQSKWNPEQLEKLHLLLCKIAARIEAEDAEKEQETSNDVKDVSEEVKNSA